MSDLKAYIRDVPDFPRPGILFRDIAPLLRQRFEPAVAAMGELLDASAWDSVDAVGAIESRGFMLGSALALRHGKGFVPIRKKGKLPPPVESISYDLEYGQDTLQMQRGEGRILVVDDVLATGGTLAAAADLCTVAGYRVAGLMVLIDLRIVPTFRWQTHEALSVLQY
jgi:adenine phosphoribosyltransferase